MPDDKLIKQAYETIQKLQNQLSMEKVKAKDDHQSLLGAVAKDILRVLQPLLDKIASNSKVNAEEIRKAVSGANLKVTVQQDKPEVTVNVPDVIVPDFPEIKVPTPIVNYFPPEIRVPEIKMPDKMNIEGWVGLMGVSLEKPLPVQLRNPDGSPVNLLENLTTIVSGGGGGRGIVKISGYDGSAFGSMLNADGRLRVETNDSGGSTTEVRQVSGAVDSVVVNDVLVTVGVNQVSGANWSVAATQVTSPWVVSASDLDIRDLNITQDEILVHQVSGSNWSVEVSNSVTVSATNLDIRDLDNASDSVRAYQLSGAIYSTQGNLVARTTNPSAASDATAVLATADDLGRTLTRPVQVRDLIATAYVSVTGGTETTLLAASAGVFHDLIMLVGSNNSDAAVSVDVRAVTAGNIVHTLRIPANGTAGFAPAVPWPQDATGNNWTVDGPDESGRTLTFSALFSKEI